MNQKALKKTIIFSSIFIVVVVVLWVVFFRPCNLSQQTVTDSFEAHKTSFNTVAEYLTTNNISTEISGFITYDEDYGVPVKNDKDFRKFVLAVEELTSKDCKTIISNGKTVEFVYHSDGGILTKINASVIYNRKKSVEGKITVQLNTEGWHLYIYGDGMEG